MYPKKINLESDEIGFRVRHYSLTERWGRKNEALFYVPVPIFLSVSLGEQGIFSWAGNHYALEPLGRLGLESTQRVGLVHYNTPDEVDQFLEVLETISH